MKIFVVLVLTVTALFVWQRSGNDGAQPASPALEPATNVAPVVAQPVSEHNWAKHSIDRAHEVANQVQETRRQDEQP
ncbi:MAG: hypothetical protein M3429_06960 [Verrucomicrobiota bacterium]|nr:hypothetical protein [Verrucomicrobiota bacterium]